MRLSADELLAGGGLTYEVEIPASVLQPAGEETTENAAFGTVKLKPLTVSDLQRISRAAKDNDNLTATLMVQSALVEPELTVMQTGALHVGLVEFLLHKVNQISGIHANAEELNQAATDPLAKAAFILAKEYGWTPEDVNNLTLGQVVLHLQMLKNQKAS